MMRKEIMAQTAQLEEFDEALYKVRPRHAVLGVPHPFPPTQVSLAHTQVSANDGNEENDRYLIATSEQPISGMHCDENIDPKSLPIR